MVSSDDQALCWINNGRNDSSQILRTSCIRIVDRLLIPWACVLLAVASLRSGICWVLQAKMESRWLSSGRKTAICLQAYTPECLVAVLLRGRFIFANCWVKSLHCLKDDWIRLWDDTLQAYTRYVYSLLFKRMYCVWCMLVCMATFSLLLLLTWIGLNLISLNFYV